MSSLMELKNISKSFGAAKALTHVDFDLKQGEIHALVGENGAGKSTLINIFAGIHQPDGGEIFFDGKRVSINSNTAAKEFGISVIHQELLLCETLNVMENIFLGCLPGKVLVDWKQTSEKTLKHLRILDDKIKPDDIVGKLTTAQKQIVEITKALSKGCKILIMDEPTSALTNAETDKLLNVVKTLRDSGISIIYISHKLEEVFSIADRITVLRDGHCIKTVDNDGVSRNEIIKLMVGREINDFYVRDNSPGDGTVLEVTNLSGDAVKGASFFLKKGEILGFSGLIGAGRSELMRMVFGIDTHSVGTIALEGKHLKIKSPKDAMAAGLVFVPEDRKTEGLFLRMTLIFNFTIANLKAVIKRLRTDISLENESLEEYQKKLKIKMADKEHFVASLSGGNQQKVLIARWLFVGPKVLILDEPTKGVDVGAKADIYKLLDELTATGVSIIVVSSELQEIIGMCDRVYVMHERKIRGCVEKGEMSQENIINIATGGQLT